MMIWQAILILFGIVSAVMALCAMVQWFQKKHPNKQFDERQAAARGKGNGVALLVGAIYYVALSLYLDRNEGREMVIEPSLLVLGGVFLMLLTVHIHSAMADAALPLGQKPIAAVGIYSILAVMNILLIIQHISLFGPEVNGGYGGLFIKLLVAIIWIVLAVTHLIAYLRDKRAAHA